MCRGTHRGSVISGPIPSKTGRSGIGHHGLPDGHTKCYRRIAVQRLTGRDELGLPVPIMTPAPQSLLQGGVVLHRLPAIPVSEASGSPQRKRLLLPAGELAQLTADGTAFRYLACLELREGTERGNHLHRRKQEAFYLLSGAVTLFAQDPQQEDRVEIPLQAGDLVFIAPGIAHGLRVLQSGFAVEFSPEPFDPADTERHPVVPR